MTITYKATKLHNTYDSPYNFNNYGVGVGGGMLNVGERLFVLSRQAWYGRKDDMLMPSRQGSTVDPRQLITWHVYDVDTNTASLSVVDSWKNYATDTLDPGVYDTPVLGVQDKVNETTASGDMRLDEGANNPDNLSIIGEDTQYHWVGLNYDPELSGEEVTVVTHFKIRKSDGKVFRPDGQPGFPSSSRGEDLIISAPIGEAFGPIKTSQGIVVGTVSVASGGTHFQVHTWLLSLDMGSGSLTVVSSNVEALDSLSGGGIGSRIPKWVHRGDVTAVFVQMVDYANTPPVDEGSFIVTVGASGQLLDTLKVSDIRLPGDSVVPLVSRDGLVVAGTWHEWTDGSRDERYAEELLIPLDWGTGRMSGYSRRKFPAPFDVSLGYDAGEIDPPRVTPLEVTGGGVAAAYYYMSSGGAGQVDAGVRISTVAEIIEDFSFPTDTNQFTQIIDDATLTSLNVPENGLSVWGTPTATFPESAGYYTDPMFRPVSIGGVSLLPHVSAFRHDDPQDGGASSTRAELMLLSTVEAFWAGFRFDGMGTGPKTRRMSFLH